VEKPDLKSVRATRQTYGYLFSRRTPLPRDWYKIILVGGKDTGIRTTCPRSRYLAVEVELATSQVANQRLMAWFRAQSIACNALQFLCNNCGLSNVTESPQLLHRNCSGLCAITAHETTP